MKKKLDKTLTSRYRKEKLKKARNAWSNNDQISLKRILSELKPPMSVENYYNGNVK